MAISLLGSPGTIAENTSAATTLNVPYPTTLNSSAMMVLSVSVSATTTYPTLPSGWTQIIRTSTTGGTIGPTLLMCIKQATGSETGNLAVTTPSGVGIGEMIAFSGVDLVTPQDTTATTKDQSTSTSSTILPALTTDINGVMLVYGAAIGVTTGQATPPTSPVTFTETMDRVSGTRAGTMGYGLWGSSGSTGTVTISWGASSGKSLGALIALRPALNPIPPMVSQGAALKRSSNW